MRRRRRWLRWARVTCCAEKNDVGCSPRRRKEEKCARYLRQWECQHCRRYGDHEADHDFVAIIARTFYEDVTITIIVVDTTSTRPGNDGGCDTDTDISMLWCDEHVPILIPMWSPTEGHITVPSKIIGGGCQKVEVMAMWPSIGIVILGHESNDVIEANNDDTQYADDETSANACNVFSPALDDDDDDIDFCLPARHTSRSPRRNRLDIIDRHHRHR